MTNDKPQTLRVVNSPAGWMSARDRASSITVKLTLVLLLVSLLPLTVTTYYILRGGLSTLLREEQANLKQQAIDRLEMLDRLMKETLQIVEPLQADKHIKGLLSGGPDVTCREAEEILDEAAHQISQASFEAVTEPVVDLLVADASEPPGEFEGPPSATDHEHAKRTRMSLMQLAGRMLRARGRQYPVADSQHEASNLPMRPLPDDGLGEFYDPIVSVLDKKGVVVCSTKPENIGQTRDSRDYYMRAVNGKHYVFSLLLSSNADTPGVFLSGPVQGERDVIGVVAIKLEMEMINRLLRSSLRGRGPSTTSEPIKAFIIDNNGIVVSHPDDAWLYHSLVPPTRQQIEAVRSSGIYGLNNITSLAIPELERLVDATEAGSLIYRSPEAKLYVVGYAPRDSRLMPRWTVAISESSENLEAISTELFRQALISAAGVGIVVLLISLMLARALVRPLRSLTEAARTLQSVDDGAPALVVSGPPMAQAVRLPERFSLNEHSKAELARISKGRRDEIGQLASAFKDMAAKLREYIDDLKKVTTAKERIESEMKIAGEIQLSMLSTDFSIANARSELDLYTVVNPAKQAGGDLYDFFFVDDEHLFFVIGDVSDKGMPAALFMAVTLTLIRNLGCIGVPPDRVLNEVNQFLCRHNEAYQFVTLFCGLLHLPSGEVRYSHGGHNPPYLFSPTTGELRPLTPVSGVALGVFDSAEYKTETLSMASGDILFAYSDGITEAMNADHELFGEPRLEACLRRLDSHDSAEDISQTVLSELTAFVGDALQSDDITALCIRFSGKLIHH